MDNVIQQFIDFLIDKNLLYAYRNNIDKRPDDYTIHCESFIIGAFEWYIAPGGFKTWAKLH